MVMLKQRIHRWRSAIILLLAAVFVLTIPSIPPRRYHLFYWGAALLVEAILIFALRPHDE